MEQQAGQDVPRYTSRSREDRKSLSESFVDGTSKFFSSMVAKKNGLISDLSNKIETTFATKSDRASSSAGSEGSISPPTSPQQPVPNTPPPRPPPPPRRQPSIEAIKQARSSMKRMTSVPAYPSGKGGQGQGQPQRDSPEGTRREMRQQESTDKFSVNGMNISFDEPIYQKPDEASAPKPLPRKAFGPRGADSSPGREPRQADDQTSTVASPHKSNNVADSSSYNSSSSSNTNTRPVKQNPFLKSSDDAAYGKDSHVSKEMDNTVSGQQDPVVAEGYGEVVSPEAGPTRSSNRAPKFTSTTRRSSTVDEMLFDDYVPPEEAPVPNHIPEAIPDNLISFEPDAEVQSPSSSCSDTDAGGPDRRSGGRGARAGASVDSSDAEYGGAVINRSGSMGSEKSWSSNYSVDSQPDDLTLECMEFMKAFVDKIFHASEDISQTEKANFGRLCQHFPGRLWFSRYVNAQRVHSKKVAESVFFRLMQYFAVGLFECNEADDFSPAKTLMTMCFTFYYEGPSPTGSEEKVFLYTYLRDQPIWQSLRFWNAAFFDAVQNERSRRPMPTSSDGRETVTDDRQFQANITFGQLGTFACNMRSFGLSRELCHEFLRKQSTIANLNKDQVKLLRENIDRVNDKT